MVIAQSVIMVISTLEASSLEYQATFTLVHIDVLTFIVIIMDFDALKSSTLTNFPQGTL